MLQENETEKKVASVIMLSVNAKGLLFVMNGWDNVIEQEKKI